MTPSTARSRSIRLLVVLLTGAIVLALRRPDQIANPQLWAEDGIFFFQARVFGLEAFMLELAGYHHLAPRLIAALAQLPDPRWVPHVFVGCTLALTLYVMSRALSARSPFPEQLRPACALAVVLVPDASEVILNTVNIQWVFAGGFVLLLLAREPLRTTQRIHDLVAAAVFGLTGPFSILMTPFFAWRAWTRRTRWSVALAAVVAACALVQGISILQHPQPLPPGGSFDPWALAAFAGLRVAGGLLGGAWWPAAVPWSAGALLTAALLAVVGWLALRPGEMRSVRIMVALAFGALLASTLARCWHSMPVLCAPGGATRYVFALQLIFGWLLLLSVADPARWLRIVCTAVAVWAVAINLPRLRVAPLPDLEWERYAAKLRAGEEVSVPINPPGWTFPFPERKR